MTTRTTLRCLTVWTTLTAGALGSAASLLPAVPRHPSVTPFPELVVGLAGVVLVTSLAWAWLVTTVVVLEQVASAPARATRRPLPLPLGRRVVPTLTPRWARRLAVAACGLALLGAAPAHASGDSRAPAVVQAEQAARHAHDGLVRRQHAWDLARADRTAPLPLDGLPLPDRADAPRPARRGLVPAVGGVVVRPGDDLWSIAADLLGPRADPAAVARATTALYDANRAVVGADPDLVVPGQHLRLPFPSADRREEHP